MNDAESGADCCSPCTERTARTAELADHSPRFRNADPHVFCSASNGSTTEEHDQEDRAKWLAATPPTTARQHIAINESLNEEVVDWLETVSDEHYAAEGGKR